MSNPIIVDEKGISKQYFSSGKEFSGGSMLKMRMGRISSEERSIIIYLRKIRKDIEAKPATQ